MNLETCELEVIQTFKDVGFYKVLEFIAKKQNNTSLLLYSYLKDPSRQLLVFNVIRNILNHPLVTYQSMFDMKQCIYSMIHDLILLDGKETASLVIHFWPSEHSLIVFKLVQDQETRFKYLDGLFTLDEPLGSIHWSLSQEYFRLLIIFEPLKTVSFLEFIFSNANDVKDGFSIQKALELCKQSHLLDASLYILKQSSDYYGCLDLFLKEFELVNDDSSFVKVVESCIHFLDTLPLSKTECESFWFPILRLIYSTPLIQKKEPVIQSFIQSMISHLSLSSILLYIVQIQDHAEFGEYKAMIYDVLYNNEYEKELYTETNSILLSQTFDEFSTLFQSRKCALKPKSNTCFDCHERIHSDVIDNDEKNQIVIMGCGHVYHLNCYHEEDVCRECNL